MSIKKEIKDGYIIYTDTDTGIHMSVYDEHKNISIRSADYCGGYGFTYTMRYTVSHEMGNLSFDIGVKIFPGLCGCRIIYGIEECLSYESFTVEAFRNILDFMFKTENIGLISYSLRKTRYERKKSLFLELGFQQVDEFFNPKSENDVVIIHLKRGKFFDSK